jgi:ferredoxin
VHITFVRKDGSKTTVEGKEGQNLLRLAQKHEIELEGACECSLACSTCHVILAGKIFDRLDTASDKEEDLLDMAFGLTETSRLGCQILIKPFMEGTEVVLPKATRNFYVDGHQPKPH